MPCRHAACRCTVVHGYGLLLRENQFGRRNSVQFGVQHFGVARGNGKVTIGQVHPGDASRLGALL